VQSTEGSARDPRLIGGPGSFEYPLFLQRSKSVQAFEVLRTVEQRACVVLRFDIPVSHRSHSSNGREVGKRMPLVEAIRPIRIRCRGCYPSSSEHCDAGEKFATIDIFIHVGSFAELQLEAVRKFDIAISRAENRILRFLTVCFY
jgi:hypothetical protein